MSTWLQILLAVLPEVIAFLQSARTRGQKIPVAQRNRIVELLGHAKRLESAAAQCGIHPNPEGSTDAANPATSGQDS